MVGSVSGQDEPNPACDCLSEWESSHSLAHAGFPVVPRKKIVFFFYIINIYGGMVASWLVRLSPE